MQLTDNSVSASFPPWMSAEIELILRAAWIAERRPGSRPPACANAGSSPDLDWAKVIDIARSQGVLALVARHLKARDWDGVPQSVMGQMEGYRTTLAARNLFFTRQLLDVLGVLEAHGIAALPYKGPALAASAYGDIGLRPFGDLDIIVSRRDALAAKAVLQSVGYRSLTPRTDSQRVGGLPRGDYAFPRLSADRRVVVEVHWNLAPSLPLAFEDLIAGAQPLRLLDSTVSDMAPELLLLALCVHGTKHAWDRLEWICAVAHLVARRPPEDWGRLVEQSGSVGASRSLALGLVLAGRLAGTTVPPPVLEALGARSLLSVAGRVESGLFANGREGARYLQRFRLRTPRDRARYLLTLCRPTEKDREFVSLPRRLDPLYFLVRPLRVAHQRASRRLVRR